MFYLLGGIVLHIQIIGGGAVGLLLASFFSEKNCEVTVVCRREEQVERLNKHLKRIHADGSETIVHIQATLTIQSNSDFIIVAVKSGQIENILPFLPTDKPILFIQNGLSHYTSIKHEKYPYLAFGSAQFGATKKSDAEVYHKGIGALNISAMSGNQAFLKDFLAFSSPLLPIHYQTDTEKMLFDKALLNCYINPLTTILQVKNGQLLDNPFAFQTLQQIHRELELAFPNDNVPFEKVEELCRNTAHNTSSMLADHFAQRRSEAPAIIGAVLEKAKLTQQDLPTLSVLYQIIMAIEIERGFKI